MSDRAIPSVTALVPTYNGAAFVAHTLASLAAQDYPSLRVLVSDDASTDATWQVCQAFAARDARFTVVRQAERLGWVGNSNALLARVDADYAFFAPHDDVFAPTYVSRLVAALASRPDAVLAFADTIGRTPDGSVVTRTAETIVRPGGRVRRGLRYVVGMDRDRWSPFRGLGRAEAFRRAGGLQRAGAREADADGRWLFRLHLLGPFVRVPEVLCTKGQPASHLHASWSRGRATMMARCAAYAREIADADLLAFERAVLLVAVGVRTGMWLTPRMIRRRFGRLIRRLGI